MSTTNDTKMDIGERSYLDQFLEDEKRWVLFEQERLAYKFGDLIETALEENNTSQSDLAERLKKSPSVISRALNAGSNLTIRTMVEIAGAAGLQIVDFQTRAIPSVSSGNWEQTVPGSLSYSSPSDEGDTRQLVFSARNSVRGLSTSCLAAASINACLMN